MQGVNAPGAAQPKRAANNSKKRYPHSFWWYLKMFFITLQLVVFCAIVVTLAIGKGIYDQLSKIVPDVNLITQRVKTGSTKIWSAPDVRTGKRVLLAELRSEERQWLPIEDLKITRKVGKQNVRVPGRLIDATLSIEDARFYSHPGMDPKRIAGAALANFRSGAQGQGGSTITEQLAVNIYLKRKKTLARRLQTALLALQLERRFSKDEILEMYLNEIPYGNRADGCEAAARTYFNKSASDLSIAQAAFMAGLPQGPGRLNPFEHFDRAKKRQGLVLREMLQNGKINYTQYVQAKKDTGIESQIAQAHTRFMEQHSTTDHWVAPYFVSYVKQFLEKNYNYSEDDLNKRALQVYTTLDPQMQQNAETLVRRRLEDLSSGKKLQGALVCIDPWTGGVLAMVGGRNYYDTKNNGEWNRAVQGKRQSGSTFKPFVYATAMEQGYTPNSIVIDSPLHVLNNLEVRRGGHEIKNYAVNGEFPHYGPLPFYKAIGKSNNVAAVRVLMKVGIQNVVEKAHLMGIESKLDPVPSMALGTSDISLLENTSAFGVFATRGLRAEETPIDHVNGPDGETLIETEKPVRGARVLSQEAGNKMWQMLRYVVTSGTGQKAQIDGVEVIGKTGTTSNNKDVWFMGATKQLVTGVWIGYDRPSELHGSSGGAWSAPLWRSFMVKALETWRQRNVVATMIEDARATTLAKRNAEQTKKYVMRRICDESGLLATSGCPHTSMVQFSAAGDDIPTQVCAIPAHVQRAQELQDKSGRPRPGDLGYDNPSAQSGNASSTAGTPSESDATARAEAGTNAQNPAGTGDSVPENSAPPADATSNADASTNNLDNGDGANARNQNTSYDAQNDAANRRAAIRMAAANEYSNAVSSDVAPAEESDSSNEVLVRLCADSGDLATRNCPVTVERFFAPGDVPKKLCTLHRRR